MDCFFLMGVLTLVSAPLVWLTQKYKVGGAGPAH
jgi:hypothetical protein